MTAKKKINIKETLNINTPLKDIELTPVLFDPNNTVNEAKINYKKLKGHFIQLHVSNIYDLFSSGLILPVSLIEERTIDDIQTRFPNYIVISEGFIDFFDKSQCLIEVVLKPFELIEYLDRCVIFYNRPIPISRIKRIIINDIEVKKKIINTSLTQDVGFIPETLFSYFDLSKYEKIELKELPNKKETERNYRDEISIYDKILGLFAFIKNQQLYYAQTTKIVSNYSEHFLEIFSIINSEIESKYGKYIKPEFVTMFKKLFDFSSSDNSTISSYIVNYLYTGGLIDNDFITKFFTQFSSSIPEKKDILSDLQNKLLGPIGKKNVLKHLYEINKSFYQVAYLYIYGKKGSNDKEILKNTIREELIFSQSEITLALLGLYYGYKQLRTSETISLNDPYFERIFGTEYNIKFRLNSKLDYIIIESVYEFVFNKKCGDKDVVTIFPEIKGNLLLSSEIQFDPNIKVESMVEIFGVPIYRIKKQNDFEKISNLLLIYPDKIESHFHLVSFIRKYYDKDYFILRGSRGIVFKNDFLALLKEEKIKILYYDHFLACIDLDKKYNLR